MLELTTHAASTPRFLKRLLIATDGSESGERAVAFAIALAKGFASEIEMCNAFDRDAALLPCCTAQGESAMMMPLVDELEDTARSIVERARDRARAAGLVATSEVLDGRAVTAVLNCAMHHHFDAIVVGTEGKTGLDRLLEGSTADGVLRGANVPVFVVPPKATATAPAFARILLAIDDSEPSDAATGFAIDFAAANNARLTICSIAETSRLVLNAEYYAFDPAVTIREIETAAHALVLHAANRAAERNVTCERLVLDGDPADRILELTDEDAYDIIAIGTHGRRGLRRWIVESVAESVVRRSRVPVVVVRAA